jgi:hypothetical protein
MLASVPLLLVASGSGVATIPASDQAPAWRLTAIDLSVDVNYKEERLAGTARLEIENVSAQPASTLSLLLGRLMHVDRVGSAHAASIRFEQRVAAFADSPREQVDQALVHLPERVPPGGRLELTVGYSGYLVGYVETGSLYIRDHIDPEFTILRADAYAFPVVGSLSKQANRSIPRQDFPFDVRVTVPRDLTVATGGDFVGSEEHGDRTTWHYRSVKPAPFLNVAIAPYEVTDADGIRLFAFPKDHDGAVRVRRAASAALALYERWFGPTAAPPHFSLIEIPRDWGSQASLVAGIIQTASTFEDPGALIELYHEMSHFWNVADTDPLPPRWNEGLAMFLQQCVANELEERKDFDEFMELRTKRLREHLTENPRLATIPFADYGKARMTDESYVVGRLMFAVLHKTVGPEAFRAIIGGFYQQYRATGATTQDFIRFAGERGGAAVQALLADWMTSTRWTQALSAGRSLDDIAASYRTVAARP